MMHWHLPAPPPERVVVSAVPDAALSVDAAVPADLFSAGGGMTRRWKVVVSLGLKWLMSLSIRESSRNLPANNNRTCAASGGLLFRSEHDKGERTSRWEQSITTLAR